MKWNAMIAMFRKKTFFKTYWWAHLKGRHGNEPDNSGGPVLYGRVVEEQVGHVTGQQGVHAARGAHYEHARVKQAGGQRAYNSKY